MFSYFVFVYHLDDHFGQHFVDCHNSSPLVRQWSSSLRSQDTRRKEFRIRQSANKKEYFMRKEKVGGEGEGEREGKIVEGSGRG